MTKNARILFRSIYVLMDDMLDGKTLNSCNLLKNKQDDMILFKEYLIRFQPCNSEICFRARLAVSTIFTVEVATLCTENFRNLGRDFFKNKTGCYTIIAIFWTKFIKLSQIYLKKARIFNEEQFSLKIKSISIKFKKL